MSILNNETVKELRSINEVLIDEVRALRMMSSGWKIDGELELADHFILAAALIERAIYKIAEGILYGSADTEPS